jgi:hypothetical protein
MTTRETGNEFQKSQFERGRKRILFVEVNDIVEAKPCDGEPCAGTASTKSDECCRGIELLIELNEQLAWPQLVTLLERIESNHWKLAQKYGLSVHVVHSLEHLCCEPKILPRNEITIFLQSKIRISSVAVLGELARSA